MIKKIQKKNYLVNEMKKRKLHLLMNSRNKNKHT